MSVQVKEFNEYREKMNEVILSKNNLVLKRLWNLDTNTYEDGALDKKTKEMLWNGGRKAYGRFKSVLRQSSERRRRGVVASRM